jgi:hypothetical protein
MLLVDQTTCVISPEESIIWDITHENCSNKANLRTILGETEEALKNTPHSYWSMHPIEDSPANGSPLQEIASYNAGVTLMLQPWHLHLTWTYNLLQLSWRRLQAEVQNNGGWYINFQCRSHGDRCCDDIFQEYAATVFLDGGMKILECCITVVCVLIITLGSRRPKLLKGHRWRSNKDIKAKGCCGFSSSAGWSSKKGPTSVST